jgi:predicted amidophosphoribosyltransferase
MGLGSGRHAADPGFVRRAVTDLVRLVLPVSCAGCGRLDEPLCPACRSALPREGWPVPDLAEHGAPPTWAGGDYAGALQRVVLAFKDDGRHDVAPVLGRCLGRSCHSALKDLRPFDEGPGAAVLLVPAPSSRAAVRRRGADLTAGLAADAAAWLRRRGHAVAVARVLVQRRRVRDQAGLSADARHENLAGALAVRRPSAVANRRVLLVDDVVTTGATLAAAARELNGSGAVVLGAVTIAATPKLSGFARGVSPSSVLV